MGQHVPMRLLILGGNVFLGRATALAALDAGDDVSSRPSHVQGALAALADRASHWVYVSSGSVYTDSATPNQRVSDAPTHDPAPPDLDDPFADSFVNYGPCKVACERAVIDAVGAERAFICRAGLIVGPEDRSDRFTFWPERMARGGEVLAPGTPDDLVQWVDVRDLGTWLALAGRTKIACIYDGIGAPVPRVRFLHDVAAGVGVGAPRLVWVDDAFLAEHGVNPWAGPRSLPLWLPLPEYGGFLTHDAAPSAAAGLATRPLADTAHDTLVWVRSAESAKNGSGGTAASGPESSAHAAAAGGSAADGAPSTDGAARAAPRKAGLM